MSSADSANVRIITIHMSRDDLPQWEIGSPRDHLDDTPAPFHFVQEGSWLPDAEILITDSGSAALKIFDGAGVFLRSFGGSGEGPGEFGSLGRVSVFGDTILAYDRHRRTVQHFDRLSGFVRSIRLPESIPLGIPLTVAALTGTLFVRENITPHGAAMTGPRVPTLMSSVVGLQIVSTDSVWNDISMSGPSTVESDLGSIRLPFAVTPAFATSRSGIWYTEGTRFEVTLASSTLATRVIIRWPTASQAPGRREVGAVRERMLERSRSAAARRIVDLALDEDFLPNVRPEIGRLMVDDRDRLWVSRFVPLSRDESEWIVFDASHFPIARVPLPDLDGIRLLAVRGTSALIYYNSSSGTPRVARVAISTIG